MDEAEFPDPAWGDLDWLSEEKYNILKEKHNMTKKKKTRRTYTVKRHPVFKVQD